MLVTDAIDDYLLETRRLSPRTRAWYSERLANFAAWCRRQQVTTMEQVTAREVRLYLTELETRIAHRSQQPLAAQTRHGHAQVLKQWLRWCGREEYCPPMLYERVKLPKVEKRVIKTLGKNEIQALFAATAKEVHPLLAARDRALLATLLSTGMRASEACGLRLGDVHLANVDDPYVLVHGKGNKQREVGLAAIAVKYLRRYLRLRTAQAGVDVVFVNQKGRAMTPSGIDQMLYRLRDWAGIEGVQIAAHNLRRAFAVAYMAQDGADVFKLKELLGHSDIATTTIYLRAFQAKDARRGTNPLDKLVG